MFKTKKTKIVSTPVEKVLEVKSPTPVKEELVAINFARVTGTVAYITYGVAVDYNGFEYEFEWDTTQDKLCRLSGSRVTQSIWDSASKVLEDFFIVEDEEDEVDLESVVSQQVSQVVDTLTQGLKALDEKVEKIANAKPQTVVRQEVPRVQEAPRVQIEAPTASADPDDDLMVRNALKYLQESENDDLGVDYLSL